jgi:hypothetical protein
MREPPGEDWVFFGKHQHRFEPPDLYVVCMNGDVSEGDMLTQVHTLGALAQRAGHAIFWIADVRNIGVITPDARRVAAKPHSPEVRAALRGSAIYGASFTIRVMLSMVARAIRALNPTKIRPLAFVETEAEARAFLKAHGQGRVNTA